MIIDSTNIELLIFDYFEGNLGDQDKTQLLNFIHQNPAYEKEFSLWAQSYGGVDDTLQDYGITNNLLRKPTYTRGRYVKNGIALILLVGFVGSTSLVVYDELTNKKLPEDSKSLNKPISESIEVLSTNKKEVIIEEIKKVKVIQEDQPEMLFIVEGAAINNIDVKVTPINTPLPFYESVSVNETILKVDSLPINKVVEISTVEASTVEQVQTANEITSKKEQLLHEEEEVILPKEKQKKKRRGLNLKPNTKFLPVNPNF